MARYAKKSSTEDLKQAMLKAVRKYTTTEYNEEPEEEHPYWYLPNMLIETVNEDFKINFDFENHYFQTVDEDCENEYNEAPECGFIQLGDFAICLAWAGGDWEDPMYFAIYLSDKNKLRVYIPTNGNTFNVWTKTAYGSESENVEGILKMPKKYINEEYRDKLNEWLDDDWPDPENVLSEEYYNLREKEPDFESMLEDIRNRIQVKD